MNDVVMQALLNKLCILSVQLFIYNNTKKNNNKLDMCVTFGNKYILEVARQAIIIIIMNFTAVKYFSFVSVINQLDMSVCFYVLTHQIIYFQ